MSQNIPLPHSKSGPYKGNYWGILEKDLKKLVNEDPSIARLQEVILKYVNRSKESTALVQFRFENMEKVFSRGNNLDLVPFIAELAMGMPRLFPKEGLQMLRRGQQASVSLTRRQVRW